MLVQLTEPQGWTPKALWEDLKFDVKHYSDVDRLAVVGDDASESWMANIAKPFTAADVRFFPKQELDRARGWVLQSGADAS